MKNIDKRVIRMVWYKDALKDIRDYCERHIDNKHKLKVALNADIEFITGGITNERNRKHV